MYIREVDRGRLTSVNIQVINNVNVMYLLTCNLQRRWLFTDFGRHRVLIVHVKIEALLYSCSSAHHEGVWRMEILLHSLRMRIDISWITSRPLYRRGKSLG